jgi:hypothetical protein
LARSLALLRIYHGHCRWIGFSASLGPGSSGVAGPFTPEPRSLREARAGPERYFWLEAAENEIRALTELQTWQLVPLPPGRRALSCKWVFKRKLNANGTVERYKARLVIRGFEQLAGVDFFAVFAPVARRSTVRLFFSVVASRDLECHAIDVSNAFVQSELSENDLYMQQPPGFNDGSGMVCHLHKSLYGLKQAPRLWHQLLAQFLLDYGFVRSC